MEGESETITELRKQLAETQEVVKRFVEEQKQKEEKKKEKERQREEQRREEEEQKEK